MSGNSANAEVPAYVDCPHCRQRLAHTNGAPRQLFACPHCGRQLQILPPASPLSPTAVPPTAAPSPEKSSPMVKYVLGVAGVVTLAIVGTLLVITLSHDSWESYHGRDFVETVKNAEAIRESNPLGAYRMLEGALDEASLHVVNDPGLQRTIENAKAVKDTLFVQVEQIIREQEAETRKREEETRLAKEKETRQIAEAKRAKDEAAEMEARREKQKKERQAAAHARVKVYADVPKLARNALNAAKRIEARTEIGVTDAKYSEEVGDSWGDVKIFVESPEGKQFSEFSSLLLLAINSYKSAMDSWKLKLDTSSAEIEGKMEDSMQTSWKRASEYIRLADKLLTPETCEKALQVIAEMLADEEADHAPTRREPIGAIESLGGRIEQVNEGLSVRMPPHISDGDLSDLQGLSKLQELWLDGTQVTDKGLKELLDLKSLQALFLDRTGVTDAGLIYLQGLTNLQRLSLEGTQVTDAGLTHLQGLTNLQRLALDGTQVTDAGLLHLQGLKGLQALWLGATGFRTLASPNLKVS